MKTELTHDDLTWDDETQTTSSEQRTVPAAPTKFWKILIVDDENDVHSITRLALSDFSFQGMAISFLSAFNADEAKELLRVNPDVALILLDVVMEEEDSGLRFVHYVRKEVQNHLVRIILRTGQPGQAPERRVIHDYDINDYKTKTELTFDRLYTTTVAALRSFNDLKTIDASRRGLKKIIDSSASVFQLQSFEGFIAGVLEQLTAILSFDEDSLYCNTSSFLSADDGASLTIVAGTGGFAALVKSRVEDTVPAEIVGYLREAQRTKCSVYHGRHNVIYIRSASQADNMIYFEKQAPLSTLDHDLVEVFCANLSTAFDNIHLNEQVEETRREIVFALGEIVETRSKETGFHVKRVSEYTKLLALKCGLPETEAELLKQASPLHDLGKIGIPDAILNKAGKLDAREWEIMKTHATLGSEMLAHAKTAVLKTAATIALTHHEKWDGSGYPGALKGDDIHIYGRLTAIADVFDALGSARCYKNAWPLPDILRFLADQKGKQFDPGLVELFFANIEEFLAIRDRYADRF